MPLHPSQHFAPRHPCFHAQAAGRYGRVHLPVAPDCNIQCAYCNRAHDCVHESRPGVASRVLDPEEACSLLDEALERMPYLTVAGIAGPGDPFCDPERTLATLELIRKAHPELLLCLSSNGLRVAAHVPDLSALGVRFVTITVNAVSTKVGERIVQYVRRGKVILRGREAAGVLMESQLGAISALKAAGIEVKVNTVVVPGVNDFHVVDVARRVSRLGVDLMNCIGLIPVRGTAFEHVAAPSPRAMAAVRRAAEAFVPQMRHCARCRSDAAGLLHGGRCSSPVEKNFALPRCG